MPCSPTTKVVPLVSPGLGYTHIVAYKLNHQWRQRQQHPKHELQLRNLRAVWIFFILYVAVQSKWGLKQAKTKPRKI
jgi:hypothetical protein